MTCRIPPHRIRTLLALVKSVAGIKYKVTFWKTGHLSLSAPSLLWQIFVLLKEWMDLCSFSITFWSLLKFKVQGVPTLVTRTGLAGFEGMCKEVDAVYFIIESSTNEYQLFCWGYMDWLTTDWNIGTRSSLAAWAGFSYKSCPFHMHGTYLHSGCPKELLKG